MRESPSLTPISRPSASHSNSATGTPCDHSLAAYPSTNRVIEPDDVAYCHTPSDIRERTPPREYDVAVPSASPGT